MADTQWKQQRMAPRGPLLAAVLMGLMAAPVQARTPTPSITPTLTDGSSPNATFTASPTSTPAPAPQRTDDLGTREIRGYVFDLSRGEPAAGQSAPIAGATVHYENMSQVNSPMAGSTITDAAGTRTSSRVLRRRL